MMRCEEMISVLFQSLAGVFECHEVGDYLRVTLPFVMPSGDAVELFLRSVGNEVEITDLGETFGFLMLHDVSVFDSRRRQDILKEIVDEFDLDTKGMGLSLRVDPGELGVGLMRLSQAVLRLTDLVYYSRRPRVKHTFREEVEDFWEANEIQYEVYVPLMGHSGKEYDIDFEIYPDGTSWLVGLAYCRKGKRDERLVRALHSQWWDISLAEPQKNRLTIVDDTEGIWEQHDLRRLEQVSHVVLWSNRDKILSLVGRN